MARSRTPPTWLVGERVYLRPIEPEDVPMLQRWVNTSPAREFVVARMPMSKAAEAQWAAGVSAERSPHFIIGVKGGDDIGTVGVTAEGNRGVLGIALWEASAWGKGYGTDAVRTMVDGAFRTLPLVRIELVVMTTNLRAVRSYEKAGFVREGVLRRYLYHDGVHKDVLIMSVLHEDWAGGKTLSGPANSRRTERPLKRR